MTPRTDDPLRDLRTGAWAYVWALSLFGYWLTVTQCPIRNR